MVSAAHVSYAMAHITHPDRSGELEVEVVDEESHHGKEMVQVEAVPDGIELSDESGDKPWLFEEKLL